MTSTIKLIEDYICTLCDTVFEDSIVCDKIYNPEQLVNRSACITDIQSQSTDQYGTVKCNVNISENRKTRAECITDVDKIVKNFNKSGVPIGNGLAIYMEIEYITMPIRILVNTVTAYTISANIRVTAK